MGKHARKRPNRTRIAVVATASAAAVTATIACTVLPGTPEADAQTSASDAAPGCDLVPVNHVMSQQVAIARQNVRTAEDEARSKELTASRSQAAGRAKAEAIRKAEGARKAAARSKNEARRRAEAAAERSRQDAAQRAARTPAPRPSAGATPSATASAAPSPAAGTYSDDLDGWIKEALAVMAAHGIPGTYDGIYRNIIRESSGNPQAINLTDSNAAAGIPSKGLLQVIDPTFQEYHVEGTSMDIYDPVANITAACNYAAANYGTIDNVDSAY